MRKFKWNVLRVLNSEQLYNTEFFEVSIIVEILGYYHYMNYNVL